MAAVNKKKGMGKTINHGLHRLTLRKNGIDTP
jgi:hypothetical protein